MLTIFFFRLDVSAQNILWQNSLGGSNFDNASSLGLTKDGGYIVAGSTESSDGDVTDYHANQDYWVVRLDSAGDIIWSKCLGGGSVDYSTSVCQTYDGGFIVTGYCQSKNGDVIGHHGTSSFSDAWTVKLDSAGTIQWQNSLGGTKDDRGYSIIQTADHGYMVAGSTTSNDGDVSGFHGGSDGWIAKLDSTGLLIWQKPLGNNSPEGIYSIIETQDYGYLVAGNTDSAFNSYSYNWMIKLNSAGDSLWRINFGVQNYTFKAAVIQSKTSYYYLASSLDNGVDSFASQFRLTKVDTSGNTIWDKTYGGSNSDNAYQLYETKDNHIMIAGSSRSSNGDVSQNHGWNDMWVMETDENGNLIDEKAFGGSEDEYAWSIVATGDFEFVVAGQCQSTDGDIAFNHGFVDAWVLKYGFEFPTSLISLGSEEGEIHFSPNPASSYINIVYSTEQNTTLTITNSYGSMVKQLTLYAYFKNRIVYVDDLAEGMYLVSLREGDKISSRKLIVSR